MRRLFVVASIVVAMLGLMCTAGCSGDKNSGGLQGLNGKQAADMNAARSPFERSGDPPITAETHYAAGQLNEVQGTLPQAVQQYEAALKLNPRHIPSLFRLAMVYSQQKQYPAAIATWNRYIAVTDNSAVGYSNLAFCQELSGDRAAAEVSYQAGIAKDPKNQPCHVNYGLMLARMGRLDDAKAQLGAVLSPAQVHYDIASILQQQGNRAAARAEYQEAIKIDPRFMDAQTRLTDLDKN